MTEVNAVQQALLEERYGAEQQKPDNIIWTPQVEALLSHKSVRTFLPEPLPLGAIETMVAAAQSASNSSALNQWSLVVITDPELKQRISDMVARSVPVNRIPWIEEAPALLLWVADLSRGAEITHAVDGAPVVLDYLDSFLMASIDAALAAQNAAVAAESIDLGIVYLGVMRNIAKELAEMINLPAYSFVTFGMAVGIPDGERTSSIRPRPAQPMVLHYNQYEQGRYRTYLDDYEKAYQAFRTRQNMSKKTWTGSVVESATSMDYMGGREKLRQTVQMRGFKLK
ncbi:nitroreductase family protein [Pectobacterium brasiliense]|uniref:nitroreductase family protein n=1 Tax=Pectobacterium brasiliense TaxID=180957 RepID=UPI00196946DD|nr:nitroreductase family protein [Pectobacterium brasiliense]MBN3055029.1 nitroreductase family protein [Pectobacterium brasiliense]